MRVLDALLPTRTTPGPGEQRYSFQQWVSDWFTFGGNQYGLGNNPVTTYGKTPTEPIGNGFADYVSNAFAADGVVFAVEQARFMVFAEARFQFRRFVDGRPGDLFGNPALSILESPWPGGTTGDLLARMLLDADLAGNSYKVHLDGEVVRLRPDWTKIILEARQAPYGRTGDDVTVGYRKAGLFYWEGGEYSGSEPAVFLPDEFCHFAPIPDPLASYRGMSWLTPVIREIQADKEATRHKLKFFENGATPNLVVKAPEGMTKEQFEKYVEASDRAHKGVDNAYKTYYLAGGSDVTVVGADLRQLDFKSTQGAGETRIAAAGGIHPVVLGLSEGMQGSALNAGNYTAAKRATADKTFRPLWRNAAGSLEVLVKPPDGAHLWYDSRDVAFLREDERDLAEIQGKEAQTIRSLIDAGYLADSVVAAVTAQDWTLLRHSGRFSVQLIEPGATDAASAPSAA